MKILRINKVGTFLVSIMMMTILLCCSNQVQAAQDGDYTYTVTDGKATITKYTGSVGVVTIPSTLAGSPVTSIGDHAFDGCYGLTSISIPQGVKSIGNQAFSFCAYLTTISIPQGVTSIGDLAFQSCRSLTTINIPESIITTGSFAFTDCTSLATIIFNSPTTTIVDSDFSISTATKIIGYDPSTAKDYATKYNREFEVIATPITLQGIAITTPATKLSYTIGDTLDITGLAVTGTYSDGSTKVENITAANITGFNSSTVATAQRLTITVGTKTATYYVQIVAANHNKYDWQQQRNGANSAVATSPSQ